MTAALTLFIRLIVRPLGREPGRTALTIFAIALGVAVVVAIHLAGTAATGSFQSSLETLTGDADLEISTVGGLDDALLASLQALPYPVRFSPRIEGFAMIEPQKVSIPVFGFDLIGDRSLESMAPPKSFDLDSLTRHDIIWAGSGVASEKGQQLRLTINDQTATYTVGGILETTSSQGAPRPNFIVMDIAAAQKAFSKQGRLDSIEVFLPERDDRRRNDRDWEALISAALPAGVTLKPKGSRTTENRTMMSAFRWNIQVLSYISLVVGAFLIYNTIAISVVRRRGEIGVMRALGAGRAAVTLAFLAEAAFLGAMGTALGLLLGRIMANGTVEMLAATVRSLYVSSTPGEILFTPDVVVVAVVSGMGVSLLAALAPASEAARVPPSEAMARGRHETAARLATGRRLIYAGLLAVASWGAAQLEPIGGMPLFGYLSALLIIAAAACATPAIVDRLAQWLSPVLRAAFGAQGILAPRSLSASLARTSVLVAALSTAVAMLVSVAIMVGSYRDTVIVWLNERLQADFYIQAAGQREARQYPTIDPAIADRIEALPEVQAVDRFRGYPVYYNGRPSILGAGQSEVLSRLGNLGFLDGSPPQQVLAKLGSSDHVIITETFANHHRLNVGDTLQLPLGGQLVDLAIIGIYYDYSSEGGAAIVDRKTMLKYLSDPSPSNLAIYLADGANPESARAAIENATSGFSVTLADHRTLRERALVVFDRTFTITYALEVIAILVAILGMAGALVALVIDRRRELGVLRFLGASAGQIRQLILFESGLIGLFSNTIGLALGTVLSLILIFVVNKQSFGWTIQFHWPIALLLGALTLIYVAAILAGIYPARVAVRLNPIEVVHEE
ncbi:MAG: ABC transporter permease [Acidobacteria bacterium]|nr:ABC transporter permease [Acidobacteriota bacterium]